ncbi:MAG: M20/M25/M40 family metallo-hydrolase [Gemmatimonadaceae bacterium]
MTVERGDAVALTRALVAVDSRNPSLVAGGPGEQAVARVLSEVLRGWGLNVEVRDAAPGRPNVVARTAHASSTADRPALMFNGHLDIVGTEGMTHAPFDTAVRHARIYGRGSADMKAGIAAMCAAAVRAEDAGLAAPVILAAVADEEFESLGTRALLSSGVRAAGAIVTEPTRLAIAPAHRGFAFLTVTVHGRAAHGSRWDIGVDAIRHAGLLLAELDALQEGPLARRLHPLLGPGSLHASLIEGGTGMSTYPDRCTVKLERRTLPDERGADALREVEDACARIRARRSTFAADVVLDLAMGASDVPDDAPIVRALRAALEQSGEQPRIEPMYAWTDCALLNDAGIPAICFGPGDLALAHASEEWVSIDEIERATAVLSRVALDWGQSAGANRCS